VPETSDDPFDAIVADLDFDVPTDITDVTKLSSKDLAQRYNEVRSALKAINEPIHALTERGRQLHSERGALRIELRRRNML
jgi:hypothetical protein